MKLEICACVANRLPSINIMENIQIYLRIYAAIYKNMDYGYPRANYLKALTIPAIPLWLL